MDMRLLRYSEAFKRKVVSQLESGEFDSITKISRHYGIRGTRTVHGWVRRYGKNHLLPKVVRVVSPDEKLEIERLREENRRLKEALADTRLEQLLDQSYLKVWCDQAGQDVEEVKKKLDVQLSRRRMSAEGKKKE